MMWLKLAQTENQEQILSESKQEIDSAINSLFSTDESLSPQELKDRAKELFRIEWEIYEKLNNLDVNFSQTWEILKKARDAVREMEDLATIKSGRTVYDGKDPHNIQQVVQEMIHNNEMSAPNLEAILEDLKELDSRGIPINEWTNGFQKHIPLQQEEKILVQQSISLLAEYIFENSGIKLPDRTNWEALSANSLMKRIDGQSIFSVGEYDENEYPILSFVIDKNEGISVYSEVGETDSEASKKSFDFQKEELQNFLNEVEQYFPNDWNKQITEIGDEGDLRRILETNPDDPVKLFRMMSFEEYHKWEVGEIIPPGKYFAIRRRDAVGTDFSSDQGVDRDIFEFRGIQSAFRGDFGGNLVSIVPMRLEGKKLIPVQ